MKLLWKSSFDKIELFDIDNNPIGLYSLRGSTTTKIGGMFFYTEIGDGANFIISMRDEKFNWQYCKCNRNRKWFDNEVSWIFNVKGKNYDFTFDSEINSCIQNNSWMVIDFFKNSGFFKKRV